jgi:hypothetical protein
MNDTKRISRRAALKTGMTVLAGGLTTSAAFAQDADAGKMSKSVVAYRYHHGPHDSRRRDCTRNIMDRARRSVQGMHDV